MQCFGPLFSKRTKPKAVRNGQQSSTESKNQAGSDTLEKFSVRLYDDVATLSASDGWQTDVPLHVLYRSTHLANAFSDVEDTDEEDVSITLPKGVLQSWIYSLQDFGVLQNDAEEMEGTAGSAAQEGTIESTVQYLKAADFLNDADCLDQLVKKAVAFLFPPPSKQLCKEAYIKGAEALQELPKDLFSHILTSCKQPFNKHLEVLPATLHMASLDALHPSVSTSTSIAVDRLQCEQQFEALGHLITKLPRLEAVTVSGCQCASSLPFVDPFILQLQGIVNLRKLTMNHVFFDIEGPVALAKHFWNNRFANSLQELNLTVSLLPHQDVPPYIGQLSRLKALTALELQDHQLTGDQVTAFAQSLVYLTKLRRLCLAYNNISGVAFGSISARFSCLTLLEDLDLSKNEIFDGYSSYSPLLGRFPFLRNLNLSHCGYFSELRKADFSKLLCSMNHVTALQSINLSFQSLGVIDFMCSIGSLASLRTLILFSCNMGTREQSKVLNSVLLKVSELRKLDLGRTFLFARGTSDVNCLTSIAKLQQLTSLNLGSVGWEIESSGTGLSHTLVTLQKHHRLQHLDLSGNGFPGHEAEGILSAVCGFTSLRSVNISSSNLLPESPSTFYNSNNLSSLQSLNVSAVWYHSLDQGSHVIGDICKFSSLQILDLSNNVFKDYEFTALLTLLSELSVLSGLGLANCRLEYHPVLDLASELRNMGSLRELDVQGNRLSDDHEFWAALVPALCRWPDLVCLYVDFDFKGLASWYSKSLDHLDVVIRPLGRYNPDLRLLRKYGV